MLSEKHSEVAWKIVFLPLEDFIDTQCNSRVQLHGFICCGFTLNYWRLTSLPATLVEISQSC